jgi:hypothetical protein
MPLIRFIFQQCKTTLTANGNAADVADARVEVDSLRSKGSSDAINQCVQLDSRRLLVECDGQCHGRSAIIGNALDTTDNMDGKSAGGLANAGGRVAANGALTYTWDVFNLDGEQIALVVVSDVTVEDCCSGSGQLNEGEEGSNASKSRGECLHDCEYSRYEAGLLYCFYYSPFRRSQIKF